MKEEILSLAVGSVALGVIVGSIGAAITAAVVYLKAPRYVELRERIRFVNRTFAQSASFDRGFVRWKMRLDRIFSLLVAEGLGAGTVVDLGCGYGMALCFAAFGEKQRRICGCDLNAHRIEVAKQALGALNAEVCVADVRNYELPQADLILILDVLQYLSAEEQLVLLRRCCAALVPQGRLIFRVHDRQRGLWTAITMAFDGLLFRCEHVGAKPLMLTGEQYQNLLVDAGMQVETRRFRNRLPLAHILFVAKKPLSEIAS